MKKKKENERWLLEAKFTFLSIKNVGCIWNLIVFMANIKIGLILHVHISLILCFTSRLHFLNFLSLVFFQNFDHFKTYFKTLKGYLRYKTITSQNVSSDSQVKKVMFHSQVIQVFVFLTIPWFTKSVTSWWVLVYETMGIFEYLLNHNSWSHQTWSVDRCKQGQ